MELRTAFDGFSTGGEETLIWAGAGPGDVCNDAGDIRLPDDAMHRKVVKTGVVYVTEAQARAAEHYGWEQCEPVSDNGLTQVRRFRP